MASEQADITVLGRDRIDLFRLKTKETSFLQGIESGPMLLCKFLSQQSRKLKIKTKFRDLEQPQSSDGEEVGTILSFADLSPANNEYNVLSRQSYHTILPQSSININVSHKEKPEKISPGNRILTPFLVIDDPEGEILSTEQNRQLHLKHLVIILDADDLRDDGIPISRNLSWEKTATHTVELFKSAKLLGDTKTKIQWIIRFSQAGVVVLKEGPKPQNEIYFDSENGEGDVIGPRSIPRSAVKAAFLSGFIFSMVAQRKQRTQRNKRLKYKLMPAIKRGLCSIHSLGRKKFPDLKNFAKLSLQYPKLKPKMKSGPYLGRATIPSNKQKWSILQQSEEQGNTANQTLENNIFNLATRIVNSGIKKTLKSVPIVKFGEIVAADRSTIENFHTISNKIEEYLQDDSKKPLSIGVFGAPGSGKSYGIKQIIRKVTRKNSVEDPSGDSEGETEEETDEDIVDESDGAADEESVEETNGVSGITFNGVSQKYPEMYYNLSQFLDYSNLVVAFQKVRDKIVSDQVPIVYFDEFDTTLGGELGWLKYFLAPMQDGTFFDHGDNRPIGKAIFIFIGGTAHTYEAFKKDNIQIIPSAGSATDISEITHQRMAQQQMTQQKVTQALTEALQEMADAQKAHQNSEDAEQQMAKAKRRLASAQQHIAEAEQELATQHNQDRRGSDQSHAATHSFNTALQNIEAARASKADRAVKKPDFVSRLQGHLDIPGYDKLPGDEPVYMIRRAIIIHSKSRQKGFAGVEHDVLSGLLKVKKYKHGARSIEAIIDGSSTTGNKNKLDRGALPDDLLDQNLNLNEFDGLVKGYPTNDRTKVKKRSSYELNDSSDEHEGPIGERNKENKKSRSKGCNPSRMQYPSIL
ncbi:hypothetical protein ASPACDRAFT_63586 [Aspergillus aculeatus ATCC 16872]|uniref:ATPase AAA-type core domain-containing protein n=1 Tax=Aspergillus aculeatus (strain ATCC 16872 / CBS 172.66 / WB 5094) TaxID=690307 RepID=A0A1L9WKK4_ASPA1|nr:uncharacterized protein ASPACDRAFT_63586 [Aspergillus aculeatus ATCC 16872]OJJ96695.1 hypothetical protein ASPACDRAFT_63586 [Aspergillus aculeatus ATCC 16872]